MRVMNKCIRLIGLIAIVSAVVYGGGDVWAQPLTRVFILHSYEFNHVCGQPQHDGVVAALKNAGFIDNKNLEIQVYYMDTKRKNNTPELINKQAAIALEKIEAFRPDILVTLDDNAFKSVALKLVDTKISIVFSGMNGQPEIYNRQKQFMESRKNPGRNITGVYEKLHIADAIRVHSRMFPDVQKVIFFTDKSPTGKAIYRQIKLELEAEPIPIAWELKKVRNWEEYKVEILAAYSDPRVGAIYPAALLLKDENGVTYTASQIFQWTTQVSEKPEIALNPGFARLGLFGGAAVDFYAMGQQAGKMVVRILEGEKPGSIAIEEAARYALAFNMNRARQLNIEISSEILLAADEVIR